VIPHYGIFSRWYFGRMMKEQQKQGDTYSSFKKDHGPPYGHWSQEFDELKDNEYL
jgi:hypothetical protein